MLYIENSNTSEGNTSRHPSSPDDVCPYWDTDCDDISNAVETNDANSYLYLDPNWPDPNPSIAHGLPCNGWIEDALNMVNYGTGYYHYPGDDPTDTDDWGVLHLIDMIEGASRDWYGSDYCPPRIGVGDLSKGDAGTQEFGGNWLPDHTCHQNGLEVDIRYVRNDGQDLGLNIYTQSSLYDQDATIRMMNLLCWNANVAEIIVGQHAWITGEVITVDTTTEHDNHCHVRIEDPDGTGN